MQLILTLSRSTTGTILSKSCHYRQNKPNSEGVLHLAQLALSIAATAFSSISLKYQSVIYSWSWEKQFVLKREKPLQKAHTSHLYLGISKVFRVRGGGVRVAFVPYLLLDHGRLDVFSLLSY